jgi:hypothetical protein
MGSVLRRLRGRNPSAFSVAVWSLIVAAICAWEARGLAGGRGLVTFTDIVRHLTSHHTGRAIAYGLWLFVGWRLAPLHPRAGRGKVVEVAAVAASIAALSWTLGNLPGALRLVAIGVPALLMLALAGITRLRPALRVSEWLAGPRRWLAGHVHHDAAARREPAAV